jgi:hypothetical protein
MLKMFKKKTRAQIVCEKAESILHDILISGLSDDEISTVLIILKNSGKKVLQNRQSELTKELQETIAAINRL